MGTDIVSIIHIQLSLGRRSSTQTLMVFPDFHWTRREAALDYINSFVVGQIQAMPVTAEQVQVTTRCDPVLSQVFRYVQDGWPATINDKYKPFYKRKDELSIEAGCLLWGNRIIVPEEFRSTLRISQ